MSRFMTTETAIVQTVRKLSFDCLLDNLILCPTIAIKFKFELVLMVESHQTYQLFSLPLVSECVNLKQLLKHFSDSEVKNVILEHIPFRILKNIDIVFSYM